MAGTPVLDEIELIIEDTGGSGGAKPPARDDHGDDGGDGGNGGGGGERERRPESGKSSPKKYSTAVGLGILSIMMFFLVLTAAFVALRVNNLHTWSGIRMPWILWVNTAVLLTSSVTLEIARRKLRIDNLRGFKQLWTLTTVLGLIFVAGQIIAWTQLAAQGVYVTSRLASSFFYVFTSLHAVHLLGGICALLYVRSRTFIPGRVTRF